MQKDQKSIYVMLRFPKLIRRDILVKLYKGYILPHYYYYCSSVWQLLWSAMRTSYERKINEYLDLYLEITRSSPYRTLLTKVNSTPMCNKGVQNFLIFLYKSLFFPHFPAYMK